MRERPIPVWSGLRSRRLRPLLAIGLLVALVAGCGGSDDSAGQAADGSNGNRELTTVTYGLVSGTMNNQPLWIAGAKGYFRDVGIDFKVESFQSGANQVAALGTGDIDVGAATISAALFNAVASGVPMKLVANHTTDHDGYGVIVVRKKLVDSGAYKSPKDLKGKTIALAAKGIAPEYVLGEVLKQAGLTLKDVKIVTLSFPDQIAALKNGSIDAAYLIEPAVTNLQKSGTAVPAINSNEAVPGNELGDLIFSGKFLAQKDLATRFLEAYLRGVRFYNQALDPSTNKLTGPKGDEVAELVSKNTDLGDPAFFKGLTMQSTDPNGTMNTDYMTKVLDYFKQTGTVKSDVTVADAVDTAPLEAALAKVGKAE